MAGSQQPPTPPKDPRPKLGEMSMNVQTRPFRTKIATAALLACLCGGVLGIDTIGAHLSKEIGRTDRAMSIPVPATPGGGH